MAKLIALYPKPADAAAFDQHYFGVHVPLAKTLPGLRGYQVSAGTVGTLQGESPYHLAAILSFDSLHALQQAVASEPGQAAAADLANFTQAGVELLIFDTREV